MFSKTSKPDSKDAPASVSVPSDLPELGKGPQMSAAAAPRPLPARAV